MLQELKRLLNEGSCVFFSWEGDSESEGRAVHHKRHILFEALSGFYYSPQLLAHILTICERDNRQLLAQKTDKAVFVFEESFLNRIF